MAVPCIVTTNKAEEGTQTQISRASMRDRLPYPAVNLVKHERSSLLNFRRRRVLWKTLDIPQKLAAVAGHDHKVRALRGASPALARQCVSDTNTMSCVSSTNLPLAVPTLIDQTRG